MSIPIGTQVDIKPNIDSPYAGQWGVVKAFDGQDYFVAIWDGNEQMVFERKELRVRRK